jgi:hypothetical protein
MENLIIIAVLALFYFLFGIIVLTIVLAAAGQSLGIRRKYIQILLKVFEVKI